MLVFVVLVHQSSLSDLGGDLRKKMDLLRDRFGLHLLLLLLLLLLLVMMLVLPLARWELLLLLLLLLLQIQRIVEKAGVSA